VPENTLESFQRAVALGVGAIELDIHACEGALVVIHDESLDRTTNGRGYVKDTRLADLRVLDAGNGSRIPLLAEVFEAIPGEVGINIELKGTGTAELLAQLLPSQPTRPILISSFNHTLLGDFQALNRRYPIAPLFGRWRADTIDRAIEYSSGFINLGRKLVTEERLDFIRSFGLRTLIYTVNDLEEAKRLFRQGVWGIFTDYPDQISSTTL